MTLQATEAERGTGVVVSKVDDRQPSKAEMDVTNQGRAAAAASAAMQGALGTLPWDIWVGGLTFAREPRPEWALTLGRDWVNAAWSRLWPGARPVAALFSEVGGGGRVHLHGVAQLPKRAASEIPDISAACERLSEWWRHGQAVVEPYRTSGHGAAYCAKQFGRGDTAFWLSPGSRRRIRRVWKSLDQDSGRGWTDR